MNEKVGRNDPCPCGSGKKYKQCCLSKKGGSGVKRKLSAVWLNEPAKPQVNLLERTFGNAIASAGERPPPAPSVAPEPTVEVDDQENNHS